MTTYEFFKDFAGPLATVFAATVAATVAATFAIRQTRAAEQQAFTAHNKLKVDAFQMRFAAYLSAKKVAEFALYQSFSALSDSAYRENLVRAYEGEFLFSSENYRRIIDIINLSDNYIRSENMLRNGNAGTTAWEIRVDRAQNLREELEKQYADFPKHFSNELSLDFPPALLSSSSGSRGEPTGASVLMLAIIGALLVAVLGLTGIL